MNELANEQMCVCLRNDVQIWLDKDKAEKLQAILVNITGHKFIQTETATINTADIIGIFKPQEMSELIRRKNGGWKCRWGNWHDKDQKCACGGSGLKSAREILEERSDK